MEIPEIDKLAAEVCPTPFKVTKQGEFVLNIVVSAVRWRHVRVYRL